MKVDLTETLECIAVGLHEEAQEAQVGRRTMPATLEGWRAFVLDAYASGNVVGRYGDTALCHDADEAEEEAVL